MLFRPCILLILFFFNASLCRPVKQDENGGEDDDYDHEEGDQEVLVVEDKAPPPPDDGSPEFHKNYKTRLQPHDADVEEQPAEYDKKISRQGDNAHERQGRLSQSKSRLSDEVLKDKDKHNVGDKLAEIEEEGDHNYDGADLDWKLDYADDREANNKFNIKPFQRHKNIANKKNKHWFDFYRNRRHVQNSKIQRANANNGKGPEDEETAIKRHIKKLTRDELELLLKSLSDEKRILLQSIIHSDENVNKREITKKAGAVEENSMTIDAGSQSESENVHETDSDATQRNLVTMAAKTLETRSVDLSENEDKVDNVAEILDSEYDFNESAMLQSAKAESKRDAREDYDFQNDGPDDDDKNIKSNNDRRINNRRLHKRTADIRDDSLADSMKSLEESFSNNLNLDSEMAPLIRVKRTHDNGRNYTQSSRSRAEEEEDNKLYNIGSDHAGNNITLPSELQASLVSADGENVLDSIEVAEPEVTYTVNDETPEIKYLLNCSCGNSGFQIPTNLPDDTVSSDLQSRKPTKEFALDHPIHPALDSEIKHEGRITPNLKLIENNSSEKTSMYQEFEVTDPETNGLQRYKRIRRRVKQTQNI